MRSNALDLRRPLLQRLRVALGRVAHDQADDRAGQHDLHIVLVLHLRDEEREQRANEQAERNTSGSEWTRRANQPISAPARNPFNVDPKTMPAIAGRVSGAETSR